MATTFTYLDSYCERAGDAALLAEPLGAFTNAAFLVAAWLALKACRRQGVYAPDVLLLILLLAAIGVGSGWWHIAPGQYSLLGDVIPILLFISVAMLSVFRRVLALPWTGVIGFWLVFQAVNFGSEGVLPRDALNGSVMYLPTWLAIAMVAALLWRKGQAQARPLGIILGLFTLSLFFRTVDGMWCEVLPFGTHFLWHILNSVVLYRVIKLLLQTTPSSAR